MNVEKPQIGAVLAVICLVILAAVFFLPIWTIERQETLDLFEDDIYVNGTHGFKLLGVSNEIVDVHSGQVDEEIFETSYFDVEDSALSSHFIVMTSMVVLAAVFIVLFLVLNRHPKSRDLHKSIALVLAFAVIFLSLGAAAYLNIFVPSEVGDSRESLGDALHTPIPNIQSFADTDVNDTGSRVVTTTWGPSVGWYLLFVVCVVMVVSIWFTESRPKTDDKPEEESKD
jgi:hypothetical protein